MRQSICASILFGLIATSVASAQSTISDRPWEITSARGPWASLLPAYELGVNSNGAPAFRDNLDDVGYMLNMKAVRRFLPTRTSVEAKGFYAYTASLNRTGAIDAIIPNPTSGVTTPFSGSPTRLRTKIDHYGFDFALRDTWKTRFGGLSAGVAFSYIAFDQTFDVDYGARQLFREDLNTDFRGGKAIFGWDRIVKCRPTTLDLGIGFYDMNSDYRFREQEFSGTLSQRLSKTTVTIEPSLTTWTCFHGYQVGATFGATFYTDMPTIQHRTTGPATLGTDDAATLTAMFEVLL